MRAANPDAFVHAPELADRHEFLVDVLAAAKQHIDIITVHRYSATAAEVFDHFDGTHWPWEDDNLKEVLEDADVFGTTPVWFTEGGWPTLGGKNCWFGDEQTEAGQAARYPELLDELAQRDWMHKIFFYELRDDPHPDVCNWGILRHDSTEKPAYGAYRDYITANPP